MFPCGDGPSCVCPHTEDPGVTSICGGHESLCRAHGAVNIPGEPLLFPLWGRHAAVELLGHVGTLCLTFRGSGCPISRSRCHTPSSRLLLGLLAGGAVKPTRAEVTSLHMARKIRARASHSSHVACAAQLSLLGSPCWSHMASDILGLFLPQGLGTCCASAWLLGRRG